MKRIIWLPSVCLLFASSLIFNSCTEDPIIDPPVEVGPQLTISDISAFEVEPGAQITFTIAGTAGTNDMSSFKITEDGTNLTTRIEIAEFTTLNNPQLLTGNDVNNFVYNATVTTPDTPGDYTYAVTVTDAGNFTADDAFTVTVQVLATPLEMSISGVLLNQAGPAGAGGIDLEDGTSTGTQMSSTGDPDIDESYLRAELRDMGIDTDLPVADNWRQEIGPMTDNGVTMKRVDTGSIENFSFDNVDSKEAVLATWDTGIDLSDEVDGKISTGIVGISDVFVVNSGDRYYLVRIDNINVTADDNADNYELSIKY